MDITKVRISLFCGGICAILWGSCFGYAQAVERLTWQDCLRQAAKNHPDLIAAQEGIVQQKAGQDILSSAWLPHLSADFNASSSRTQQHNSSASFDYGIAATQLLFDGFKTRHSVKAAQENVKAAAASFKFTSASVRYRLRTAFINVLKAQQLLGLTEDIYRLRTNSAQLIEVKYNAGTEHKGALLNAKANVSQAKYEINQANRALHLAQWQLSKELGRGDMVPMTVEGSFDASISNIQNPDFMALAKQHPLVIKANAQKNAAVFNVQTDRGDFYPQVTLTGGMSNSGGQWPPSDKATSAGVKVSWPLFEGGERLARLKQSNSVVRQLTEEQRSVQDEVMVMLQDAWAGLQDAVDNVQVQRDFLNASQERATIAQQQYSLGLISFDNWTIIDDDLVRNKKAVLNAQAQVLLAEAQWVQAKGDILEYENQ